MVVRLFVLAALVVCSASGQARAESTGADRACKPEPATVVRHRTLSTLGAAHEQDSTLQWAPAVLVAANDSGPSESVSPALSAGTKGPANARERGDRNLLAYLVIARDLRIPGAPGTALRLIPTRNALVGIPSPIVFIPRVVRSDWYGMEIIVRL